MQEAACRVDHDDVNAIVDWEGTPLLVSREMDCVDPTGTAGLVMKSAAAKGMRGPGSLCSMDVLL